MLEESLSPSINEWATSRIMYLQFTFYGHYRCHLLLDGASQKQRLSCGSFESNLPVRRRKEKQKRTWGGRTSVRLSLGWRPAEAWGCRKLFVTNCANWPGILWGEMSVSWISMSDIGYWLFGLCERAGIWVRPLLFIIGDLIYSIETWVSARRTGI